MGIESRRIAVLGDLHFEPAEEPEFRAARKQLVGLAPNAVVQLGDHGGYSHCGTRRSFQEGLDFLNGFERPYRTLLGNHDLEGPEFPTDRESVAAFCGAFGLDRPFSTVDLGPALGICLSSTRFRDNLHSHHEVYIDDEQAAWFERTLVEHRNRPTFVFSHAPIFGSGLRVLQSVHLMCPNAWLNHTDRPERFMRLLRDHPQIKLWFSAHNHLGQQYADSISQAGECTFVHAGVIGGVSRDGERHSRIVDFDAKGFVLHTFDHAAGRLTVDVRRRYAEESVERVAKPRGGDESLHFAPPAYPTDADRLEYGASVFAIARGMLVEFDREWAAPLGVAMHDLENATVDFRDGNLVVTDRRGSRVAPPNGDGRYWRVYAPNPWRERLESA